jgi:hypothetical protein
VLAVLVSNSVGKKEPDQNITKLFAQQRITLWAEHGDKDPVPNGGFRLGFVNLYG